MVLDSLIDAFGPAGGLSGVSLPTTQLQEVAWFDVIRQHPVVKAMIPIPLLVICAPIVWYLFRSWWREADVEATEFRKQLAAEGKMDLRPAACLVITAIVLTMQEYFGGRQFYDVVLKPALYALEDAGQAWVKLKKYDEYYGYVWWSFSRVFGYTVVPLALWKLMFREDKLLDLAGLRIKGFIEHLWVYAACYGVVLIAMAFFATQEHFLRYYPFYKASSRSWFDFIIWQGIYWAQFFGLEIFFRGWMVSAMRKSLGSMAVFAMAAPYCMIHYGKPYEEALGAILAGVFLGTFALKTRSIWGGLLAHLSVALSMDLLSLWSRDVLPKTFWAPG